MDGSTPQPGAPATGPPALSLQAVGKIYPDGTVAVHELSLDVAKGGITALVGPSGCGKTTTLRMINRLIEPTSGRIMIAGEDVLEVDPVDLRRHIGYVIQQVGLFPHRTVAANVGTVCGLLGWDDARIQTRVEQMLDLVGLDPGTYADRYPDQLSGGQRQRVGVARALAADPPVLLMDEPFGAVDPVARGRLQEQFLALQRQLGTTVVVVTHDLDEAVLLADRVAVLGEGGHIEQHDAPAALLARPASDMVAEFVGADRSLKRLAVTPVADARLGPAPVGGTAQASATILAEASLRDALVVLLESTGGVVTVTRGAEAIGTLTLADVHATMRRPHE